MAIAGKSNHGSTHVMAETTVAGLMNRVYGWALENANLRRQNCPGVDLIDEGRSIAVQVTSERTVRKVRETLEKTRQLEISFDRLILLLLTDEGPTQGMKDCAETMELWCICDVFRAAKELDTEKLAQITAFLEAEPFTAASDLVEDPNGWYIGVAGYLWNQLAESRQALKSNLRAAELREQSRPDSNELSIAYNNVSITYDALGDHQKALEYLLKALAIREKVLPPDHPDLAASCNNLAWTYYKLRQYEQAMELMRRAADIAERSLPEGHPDRMNYRKWAQEMEFLTRLFPHN